MLDYTIIVPGIFSVSGELLFFIIMTFISSALEGVHRRQSLYEVLTRSQGNLEAKGNLEQLIRDR